MARIFITGSADGLGQLSAKLLVEQGHAVVLHARHVERGHEAMKKVPGAENVVTGDLSSIEETKNVARQVNRLGRCDAVIHNAGVYQVSAQQIFAVNTLAPYILTCLIKKPKRLIFMSSGMHLHGHSKLQALQKNGGITYADSKLYVVMLSMAVARKWPNVYSNAVDPGWVPTKMGGRGAPDDLRKGYETQAWLAVSEDDEAKVSGRYFYHQQQGRYNREAEDITLQEKFLALSQEITGVPFPQ